MSWPPGNRIRTGRKIGSAALVADGLHARTDGLTSLAVLLGAGGVAIGWNWADPAVGLLITLAILAVLRQAVREIYCRLMDAVDPALVDQVERTLRATQGVVGVGQVRLRWIGHNLRAECEVIVPSEITAVQAHQVTVNAEHDLLHALPRLAAALCPVEPSRLGVADPDHLACLSREDQAPVDDNGLADALDRQATPQRYPREALCLLIWNHRRAPVRRRPCDSCQMHAVGQDRASEIGERPSFASVGRELPPGRQTSPVNRVQPAAQAAEAVHSAAHLAGRG